LASEIICSTTGREVRVALLEQGRVTELHIDRGDNRGYVGNVYLGRVVRVLPGMQAAFVDIGMERAAFLYVGDIHPRFLDLTSGGKPAPAPTARSGKGGLPPIQDLLSEGQELVVQIAKDPIGTKGARITTHIALPGRYLVFMPTVEHVGISRRIDKERERRRLRDFVDKNRAPGQGYIVRTVCAGQSTDVLKADMAYLERTWERIKEAATSQKAPAMIHREAGLVLRAVRDLFDDSLDRMVLDNANLSNEVRRFMQDFMPELSTRVHLYKGAEPIFDTYGVEAELQRSLGRKVWLKSGGYLVIDQTEALMAIDVNSGRFVGSSSLEETTLRINLEAVQEVVYQLRLRNMGGIIIIDFIDMEKEASRDKVYRALEEALKHDRARTNVLRISDLGLVEMTRKRVQEGLDRYLRESCPVCKGSGVVKSRSTICYDILREVRRESVRSSSSSTVYINAPSTVADMLYGEHYDDMIRTENDIGRRIVVRPLPYLHPEEFEVYAR